MTATIGFIGAKGGSCTSTFAAAVALRAQSIGFTDEPIVIHDRNPEDQRAIFGVTDAQTVLAPGIFLTTSSPVDPGLVIDVDNEAAMVSDLVVVCFRGPSYLALRRYLNAERAAAREVAVVFAEPGSALGAGEVSDCTGLQVVGTIPVSASIMRALDAGVFSMRPTHPEMMVVADRVLSEVSVSA